MIAEKFWYIVTAACVLWYSTITIYISFKGAKDIKYMLANLSKLAEEAEKLESVQPSVDIIPEISPDI